MTWGDMGALKVLPLLDGEMVSFTFDVAGSPLEA
ncbi:MAG: hypothetical protein QOE37_456 [Microbacteriaceae bacterium]|jgi:hypothetical protein|nr:hypothetical protein [Microbacteriaceae bacterium]